MVAEIAAGDNWIYGRAKAQANGDIVDDLKEMWYIQLGKGGEVIRVKSQKAFTEVIIGQDTEVEVQGIVFIKPNHSIPNLPIKTKYSLFGKDTTLAVGMPYTTSHFKITHKLEKS